MSILRPQPSQIIAVALGSAVLGDMVRYMISVAVTLGFGMVLGFRIGTSPVAAVAG